MPPTATKIEQARIATKPYRLLIFGDGEHVRTRYLAALKSVDGTFAPTTATTYQFAVRKAEEEPWDCVLLDCDQNDAADLRFIGAARAALPGVPIVACRFGQGSSPVAALTIRGEVGRLDLSRRALVDLLVGAIESEISAGFWNFRRGDVEQILVVSAEAGVDEAIRRALAPLGLEVDSVSRPDDALACLRDAGIVVTDAEFSGRDHTAWLRELRRTNPDVEVIVLATSASGPMAERVKRLGATATLVRSPVDVDRTRAVVQKALLGRWSTLVDGQFFRCLTACLAADPRASDRADQNAASEFACVMGRFLPDVNHGVVLLNAEGVIQFASPRFGQTVQERFLDALGNSFSDYLAPTEEGLLAEIVKETRRARGLVTECHLESRSGVILTALLHARTVRTASGEAKVLVALHDLTDFSRAQSRRILAQAEELKKTTAELERFAFIASHDLREPIRGMVIFAESLQRSLGDEMPARAQRLLSFITDAANRAQVLVDGMQKLAAAKTMAISRERVSLEFCVRDALARLATRVEKADAVIGSDSLPTVWGDRTMLNMVYENLLDNALKFVGDRRPEIRLTAERDGSLWILGVQDNGIGIPEKHREAIFTPRSRLHAAGEYAGEGVGLAVSRKALERLGGRIWVESPRGGGSYFKFTLDYVPADEELNRDGM